MSDHLIHCECCPDVTNRVSSNVGVTMKASGFEPVFSRAGDVSWYCATCAALIGEAARKLQILLNDPEAYLAWNFIVKLGKNKT